MDLSSKSSDPTQDSVRMYLREMGVVPLLTREGEVAVAKRIERGQLSVRKILSRSPIVVHELARLGVAIEDRERSIREIVTFNKGELTVQGIEKCREKFLDTIADIATSPWIARFERHQVDLGEFPNVKRWFDTITERSAVEKGMAVPFYN